MNDIIFGVMMCVLLFLFLFFMPLLDYHYFCKDSVVTTHISLYDLIKGNHPKGCKGFKGMDIEGQLNYIKKNE